MVLYNQKMDTQIKAFFVGLGITVFAWAGLFLGYNRIISQYENSLSCPENTYYVSYDKKKNQFKRSLITSSKIYPKEAREKLMSLTDIVKADFDGDGIEDTAKIEQVYDGALIQYHKELTINGKTVCKFYNESVDFLKSEDINKDGIKDIIITTIDHVYR